MKILKDEIKKILVVQFYQIGDVLLTTPLLRALKLEFPEATIHFCANKLPAKLLENNPYIDKIIINESKNKGLKEKIVELGYDPTFGARQMRRVIQDKVENVLASAILSGQIKRGNRVEVEPEEFQLIINP